MRVAFGERGMSFFVPPRVETAEILDGDIPLHEALRSLDDIEWVHRELGGRRLVRRHLLPLLLSLPGERVSLLDVGCGSGHVGRDLVEEMARRGRKARALGLDFKLAHAHRAGPLACTGDALSLPLRSGSVDVVISTLFLHHLSPNEVETLLQEARRVARRAVLAFDLARHRVGIALAHLVGSVALGRVSRSDGPASVRQAYTAAEMRALAERALPGARVTRAGPLVWLLVWKP